MNELELKAAIARKGLSVPRLAEAIGIGKKALYQKMRGETQFTQREICGIAEVLGLSGGDLLNIFFAERVS